MVRNVPSLKGI